MGKEILFMGVVIVDENKDTLAGYKGIYNSTIKTVETSYLSVGNNPQLIASVIYSKVNPMLVLYEFK
ncbi:MAG: hypothetical protein LBS55_03645 [Prevotellaceae bacterium]|jgi:hypothetical protein|nr:hypothetical protein [Prevotellaceae bacterium]